MMSISTCQMVVLSIFRQTLKINLDFKMIKSKERNKPFTLNNNYPLSTWYHTNFIHRYCVYYTLYTMKIRWHQWKWKWDEIENDIIEVALQAGITIRYVVLFHCVMITSKHVIKTHSTIGKTYFEECSYLNYGHWNLEIWIWKPVLLSFSYFFIELFCFIQFIQ